jgi:Tol biopolymer transport system component
VSNPTISDDGRYVAFESPADNLAPDSNANTDVFVRDRLLGTTTLASVGQDGLQGSANATDASMSGNGRFVVFVSAAATLVPNDTNSEADVFVRDLINGTTERVSVSTAGDEGDSTSLTAVFDPVLSFDGRFVAYQSTMPNLVSGDTNPFGDVYLRDRLMGTTTRVSESSSGQQSFTRRSAARAANWPSCPPARGGSSSGRTPRICARGRVPA